MQLFLKLYAKAPQGAGETSPDAAEKLASQNNVYGCSPNGKS